MAQLPAHSAASGTRRVSKRILLHTQKKIAQFLDYGTIRTIANHKMILTNFLEPTVQAISSFWIRICSSYNLGII